MGVGVAVSASGWWFFAVDFANKGGPSGGQLTRYTSRVTSRSHQTINLTLAGRQYTPVLGAWA
jgi:hypothetical protein